MNTGDKIYATNYPHLEVVYKDHNAKISIDQKMIQGCLPVDVTLSVLDWTARHETELLKKWYDMYENTTDSNL